MTFAPATIYEIPSAGQHVGVLIDEIDQGMILNRFYPNEPPKHMNRLVFAVDELGSNGQPLRVSVDVNLVRSRKGNLIKYIRAFIHPAAITPADWDTANHIGRCIGLNIVHSVKPEGTYANVDSVFPLPNNAKRLSIPAGYVRKGGQGGQGGPAFPGNQPKPAQSTAQTARTETGLQEEAQVPVA